jgi:hypothetical protein
MEFRDFTNLAAIDLLAKTEAHGKTKENRLGPVHMMTKAISRLDPVTRS